MVASVAGRNGGVRLVVDEPCRWSRRWHEDPPVGTEVKLKGGLVEVYVGAGFLADRRGVLTRIKCAPRVAA